MVEREAVVLGSGGDERAAPAGRTSPRQTLDDSETAPNAHGGPSGMAMRPMAWTLPALAAMAAMWAFMMAAMMVPAMAPVAATYTKLAAREDRGTRLAARVAVFASGYLVLWMGVSVTLAILQMVFSRSPYFHAGGTEAGSLAAGVLLVVAGGYQFSSVKEACLRHCRHPLTFLIAHWRDGIRGAWFVGLRHGLYCVGCCVVLMGLMFVLGAMNVWWMAILTLYFILEKVAPKAETWGRLTGATLLLAGVVVLIVHVAG